MGIIVALFVGLVVGAIARVLIPDRDRSGIAITAGLGVAGALVAFLVGRAAGWYGPGSEGPGINASVLGALVVLAIYRSVRQPA
jgi:uncharacterized membrane protein YeaQ/YmgE (transglycosylase-associated protein family)